ncbi:MAG TPA: hypothetical protein VL588_04225 [Bdellovibrionota bacterium]|nr:hypothetical protein [Bdellovibrionota bacterium]
MKPTSRLASLLMLAVLATPCAALAAEGTSSAKPDKEEKDSEVILRYGVALSHMTVVPDGMTPGLLNPPAEAEISYYSDVPGDRIWLALRAGYPTGVGQPTFGGTLGTVFGGGKFRLLGGVELNFQSLFTDNPAAQSVLHNANVAAVAKVRRLLTGDSKIEIEVKAVFQFDSTIANFEGLETVTRPNTAWIIKPTFTLALGPIMGMAQYGFFVAPEVAIASKDFAITVPSRLVSRPMLGAGIGLGGLEIWLKMAWVLNMGDGVEHVYRVPYLSLDDYALAPTFGSLELQWRI